MEPTNQPIVHQLVISQPVLGLKDWLHDYLDANTTRWLARQHSEDETINRTHVHYMLIDPKVSKQAFAKFLNKNGIKGSEMFGHLTVWPGDNTPYKEGLLGIYICKGKPQDFPDMPIYNKGYTPSQIDEYISGFIDYKKHKKTNKSETTEELFKTLSQKAYRRFDRDENFNEMKSITLAIVRPWVFHQMIGPSGLPPIASTFKRVSCGIYLALRFQRSPNDPDFVDHEGLREVLNWAY